MKTEDALAEAMSAHVADVHASPFLGGAVRRRRRAHLLRFRTAGAALVTATVALGVPVYLNLISGTNAAAPAQAVHETKVVVPNVAGLTPWEADNALKAVGLVAQPDGNATVATQNPRAGTQVDPGTVIQLTVNPMLPQELGDLGDGRKFGGIEIGYLPEGLKWREWSGKDRFGKDSYTTSFDDGVDSGAYSIQVIVRRGEAVKTIQIRRDAVAGKDWAKVKVHGQEGYLANFGEDGEPHKVGVYSEPGGGTHTIGWNENDNLAIEVMMGPYRADKLSKDEISAELKRIADEIKVITN